MSAQHQQNYVISPPPKKTVRNNLKRFCSGALVCCSILGGIAGCQSNSQSNNSSVKDGAVQSANSVANYSSALRPQKLNIPEKALTPQPTLPSYEDRRTTATTPGNTGSIDQADQVNDSDPGSNTSVFPQIDRNNLSEATQSVSAPNFNFSIDAEDGLIQQQTIPSKQQGDPSSGESGIIKEQINKPEKNSITEEQTDQDKEERLTKAISKVKTPQIYQSKKLGFRFKYPKGYVLNKSQQNPDIETSPVQQRIDVWSNDDFQAIKAGQYQGTELPANVSITVEENPKNLSASEWLKENDHAFTTTQNQSKEVIAGQKAVVFRSSGLYETRNIVLASKDRKKVIVISHSENQNDSDKDYEQVFEQVVSSFELRARK